MRQGKQYEWTIAPSSTAGTWVDRKTEPHGGSGLVARVRRTTPNTVGDAARQAAGYVLPRGYPDAVGAGKVSR